MTAFRVRPLLGLDSDTFYIYHVAAVMVDNLRRLLLGINPVSYTHLANPIFIAIPCHRVIGTSGSLVGYGGGLEMKKALLELERSNRE